MAIPKKLIKMLEAAGNSGELSEALAMLPTKTKLRAEVDGEFTDVFISVEEGFVVFSAMQSGKEEDH